MEFENCRFIIMDDGNLCVIIDDIIIHFKGTWENLYEFNKKYKDYNTNKTYDICCCNGCNDSFEMWFEYLNKKENNNEN